jgi:adenylosuccinate synthase
LTIFNNAIDTLLNRSNIVKVSKLSKKSKLIFEGSQGLLLDQHYGFFPNVTRSNVGSKNILKLTKELPKFFAVTRAYQTRHGNGPMTNESLSLSLLETIDETNRWNKYQGSFKTSVLDLDLLEYAVEKDHVLSNHRDNLVITCLDQIEPPFKVTHKNSLLSFHTDYEFTNYIWSVLHFKNLFTSYSNKSALIKE